MPFSPAIHPDGETLFYAIPTTGSLELRKASPENGPSELMLDIPASLLPIEERNLFQPTISPDGKLLAMILTDTYGTNLWALDTESGELLRLTEFGDPPIFISRRVSWSSDSRSLFAAVGLAEEDVVLLAGLVQ